MTLPSKPVVIRLPADAARRFNELCSEFAGLQKSQVMRMVVESVLSRPLQDQVEAVTAQIRKPGAKTHAARRTGGRLENTNQNRRTAQ